MRFLSILILLHIGGALVAQNFSDAIVLFPPTEVQSGYDRATITNTLGDGSGPGFAVEVDGEVLLMNRQADGTYVADTVNANAFVVDALEDFNGDGLLDILGRNNINYGITPDSFANRVFLPFFPEVFGYVNGDSLVDFFSVQSVTFGDDFIRYEQAELDGSYTRTIIDTVNRINTSNLGDVNQDGNLDFCFFNDYSTGSDGLVCHLGDGEGNFTREEFRESRLGSNFVVLSDLTGDGFPEAVLSQKLFPGLIYVNNNAGSYVGGSVSVIEDGDNRYKVLRAGDIDADGDNDLVALSQLSGELADEVVVYLNNGNGTFASREVAATINGNQANSYPNNQGYNTLFLDYVDDDYLLDIVVNSDEVENTYALLNTNTTGTRRFVRDFKRINVYPNPVDGSTNLKLDFGQNEKVDILAISVTDLSGRMLNVPYFAGSQSLSVNDLPAGQYVVVAEDADGFYYRTRFVKY